MPHLDGIPHFSLRTLAQDPFGIIRRLRERGLNGFNVTAAGKTIGYLQLDVAPTATAPRSRHQLSVPDISPELAALLERTGDGSDPSEWSENP
jgi:hypothetical protein